MPAPTPVQRVAEFLRTEAAAGFVLIAATVAALVWANVAPATYHDVWSTTVSLPGGCVIGARPKDDERSPAILLWHAACDATSKLSPLGG